MSFEEQDKVVNTLSKAQIEGTRCKKSYLKSSINTLNSNTDEEEWQKVLENSNSSLLDTYLAWSITTLQQQGE